MSKKIKQFVENIEEELKDAEKYAECALSYSGENTNKTFATKFATMASQELEHVNLLHSMVTEEISKVLTSKTEIPQYMMEMYNDKHVEHIRKTAYIKALIEESKK